MWQISLKAVLSTLALSLTVSACSGGYSGPSGPSTVPPKFTGVKVGKPYKINGKWYHPRFDENYEETGVASWYGPGFHGKKTANGETYNQWDYTAAHTFLPLPSMVRVENLENGRSMTVRVNDRGPFHDNRIIDLSKASAQKLGIKGLAKVRVSFLKEETLAYIRNKGDYIPDIQYAEAGQSYAPARRDIYEMAQAQSEQYIEVASNDDDFVPAPLLVSQNRGPISQTAPLTSVSVRSLPPLVKKAHAEAPVYKPQQLSQRPFDSHPIRSQASAFQPPVESAAIAAAGWAVQVASYSERANADTMMQRLVPYGQPQLKPVLINGREWYRVLLRPTSGQTSQNRLLSDVRGLGLYDARVVTTD